MARNPEDDQMAAPSREVDDLSQADASQVRLAVQQPSKLNDDDLYLKIKDWFLKDSAHTEEWRDEARKAFDFVAGDQWEMSAYTRMVKDEKRQPITFNKTATFLKMVAGLEVNGRHEIVYLPRGSEPGPVLLNEDLTQASKWMSQQCDAEDAQSTAFRDCATCGMGWTEARIDYERDPDGMYVEEVIDPIDMYWDRAARKKNLSDAQRIFRVKKMRLEDARALANSLGAEHVPDSDLDASWAIGVEQKAVKPYEEVRLKTGHGNANAGGPFEADPNTEVHVVQVQWWEREAFHRVAHPVTGQETKLSDQDFAALQAHAKQTGFQGQIPHIRQVKKVFKQAFVGGKVFARGDCPCPEGPFTFQCMTGEIHRTKGTWHGLVKLLRDPQMWTNKLFSQVIHILNTTAKGGILAEKGAFPDIREAQRTFARPDAITIVEDKAIQQNRIMQKPGVGLAAPFVQLMDISNKAFYDVSGLNIELMGARDQTQPGILEAQRKQAGMTVLATLFDARALFLKQIGRIRLHFIQTFLSDGRMMRIVGQQGYQAIPLLKDRTAGEYDIDVSDAPTSPDMKQATWQMLVQLMPFFKGAMTPQIASILLEYSPLPTKAVSELKQAIQTPNPMQVQQMQMQQQALAAKTEHEKAKTDQASAAAQRSRAEVAKDLATAILDIAQAGATVSQAEAGQVQQALVNTIGSTLGQPITTPPPVGPNVLPQGPYAIEPQGAGAPGQLPVPPQPPMAGQAQAQLRGGLDPATLAKIASALPPPKAIQ